MNCQSKGENLESINKNMKIHDANFYDSIFGFVTWLIAKYGLCRIYTAATEHGQEIDQLLMFNWWIILPVFFITNTLLFDSGKYYYREERTALYYLTIINLKLYGLLFQQLL